MLNQVALQGRLTADPELKTTQTGTSVTSFRIAVDRSYVKKGEERKVDFITIVAWRSTAEFISKYFSKGDMIVVSGKIEMRDYYEDKNGNKRTAFEVVANEASFCGSKSKTQEHDLKPIQNRLNMDAADVSVNDFEELMKNEDLPF